MTAVVLALVLVSTPAQAELEAEVEPAPVPREFRAGGGATGFVDVEGVAATAEVGIELQQWQRVGLRFTFGTALRVGWGSVYFSPEAVFRVLPRESRVSPYLTAGLQAAVLNLTEGALGHPDLAEARSAATADGFDADPTSGAGPLPIRFSAGPQAGLGASFAAFGTTLDLGVRYNLHFWEGDPYSGFGVILTVVGPIGF